MIEAVQKPSSAGLTWCNDTPHKIMAAVATDDGKAVTSRGWYRIDPGKCLHPDVTGQPKQVFSFAEAVDAENRAIKLKDKPLNWGGAEGALHAREQVRDQRTGRLRHPRACADRLCAGRHVERRQDAAICDAVMRYRTLVVPANAGTHNHRTEVWVMPVLRRQRLSCSPSTAAAYGCPAFAGTTS